MQSSVSVCVFDVVAYDTQEQEVSSVEKKSNVVITSSPTAMAQHSNKHSNGYDSPRAGRRSALSDTTVRSVELDDELHDKLWQLNKITFLFFIRAVIHFSSVMFTENLG